MRIWLSKIIIFLMLVSFLTPFVVGAVTIDNPLQAKNFWDLIDRLIDFIFYLAIAIAPIMFIIAGFYFIGAAGDPAKIDTAKKMVLWTLIGLLVVMSAKGLVMLFGEIFGVKTPYNP